MLKSTLRGSALAALLGLAACGEQVDVETAAANAAAAFRDGDVAQAVVQYKFAIAGAPKRGDLRAALARVYAEAGDGASAEKEVLRAVRNGYDDESLPVVLARAYLVAGKNQAIIDGKSLNLAGGGRKLADLPANIQATLLSYRGHAHWALRDFAAADARYDAALAVQADFPEALAGKGLVAIANNEFADARRWLNQALAKDPQSPIALSNLGALEQYEGNLDAAEAAYSKAIAARINNADDLFARFHVRLRNNDLDGAEADLLAFDAVNSRAHLSAYAKGLLAFRHGEHDAAMDAFTEALSVRPNYLPALTYAGITNYLRGHLEQALSQLEIAHEASPAAVNVIRAIADIRLRLNDPAGARAAAETLLALDPSDKRGLTILSSAAMAMGDRETGIQLMQQLAANAPESAPTQMRYGLSLLNDGQFEAGFAELERANQNAPESPMVYGVLTFGHLAQNNFDEAMAAAAEARDKFPDNPLGNNLLGGVYLAQNDLANAKEAFTQAIVVRPGDPSALHNLASMAVAEGQRDKARDYYKAVLKENPEHTRSLLKLAAMDMQDGKPKAARKRLKRAVKNDPDDPNATLALARAQLHAGEVDEALAALGTLQARHPENTEVPALMANIHLDTNDPAAARAVLEPAIERHPKSALLHNVMGKALALSGDRVGAERAYANVLRFGTRSPVLQVDTIRSLIQLGSFTIAEKALEGLQKLHGDTLEHEMLSGMLAMNRGETTPAITWLEKARGRQAEHRESNLLLARAHSRAGDVAASTAILSSWLDKFPGDTQARFQLANVLSQGDDRAKAIGMYEQVIAAEPDHALALNNLAWMLRSDDRAKALEYANRAAELQPRSGQILDTVGVLLSDGGEWESAFETLVRASKAAPQNNQIKLHLSRAYLQIGSRDEAYNVLREIVDSGEDSATVDQAKQMMARLN